MVKKVLILILLFVLCGCTHEQTEEIHILYTNDVESSIDGDIGYSGVKWYKDHIREKGEQVILVDAGDFYDGKIAINSNGEAIRELMNMATYDVVALGNQEFSIGLDELVDNIAKSDFDYVSCNLEYLGDGRSPLSEVKPYVIKKCGWTKIAFVGVTTPETLKPNKLAYEAITDENGDYIYDFCSGEDGQLLYDQIQKNVDKVRKKVDYVILLAHLGSNSVEEGYSSEDVILNTTGIDAVIDGHSHTVIHGTAIQNKIGDDVVLTSTGKDLQYLGKMTLHTDHTITTVLYPDVEGKDEEVQDKINSVLGQFGN